LCQIIATSTFKIVFAMCFNYWPCSAGCFLAYKLAVADLL
jgi:hypothetical protein